MVSSPAFTVIMALSLMRNPQYKNNNAPEFNKYMLRGSYIKAVARAPHNVIIVATHLTPFTNILLLYMIFIYLSRFKFGNPPTWIFYPYSSIDWVRLKLFFAYGNHANQLPEYCYQVHQNGHKNQIQEHQL